jgi:Fe-S-cluster containining protein
MTDDVKSAESICIGCGFCCDGTLHAHADVAPSDEAAVRAAGLSLVNDGGKMIFRQPCPKFGCGRCSVYELRPDVCRAYRCKLRKDVDEGRVGDAEAREKIAIVKALVASIRNVDAKAVTPAQRLALWRRLSDKIDTFDGEERHWRAQAVLNLGALDYVLESWFRRKKKPADKAEEL